MKEITQDELLAYVDRQLPVERRAEVEAWLAEHPDDDARVRAWLAQNQRLHEAFDGVLNEPVSLDLLRALSPGQPLWKRLSRAAAVLLAIAGAGGIGYALGVRQARVQNVYATLPRDAALAHAVFSPEVRHPVEVDGEHADHLVTWLSKRLGTTLFAPDFSAQGFHLLGGRLLAGGGGPVAQFMYEDGNHRRVTLYVRHDPKNQLETGFRHAREGKVEVFYWIDRNLGYALSGAVENAVMQRLADAAYEQLVARSK